MSQICDKPDYKLPIITQEKLNTAIAGGTAEEGLPYGIVGKCPEIYGNGQVQSVAPTTSTVGEVGDLYIALINNVVREWECVSVNGTTYIWREKLIDVSIDGASIMYNGEAVIPKADGTTLGVLKSIKINGGTNIIDANGDADIPIAGNNTFGVIKSASDAATQSINGILYGVTKSYAQYQSAGDLMFMDKGSLETVLDNESVRFDKSTSLTDAQKAQGRTNIGAATSEIVADWDNLRTL